MKKSKGVLTLEAALIMPLIIYVVLIMIFLSMLIYSRIYVALSTNNVVLTVSRDWYSMETKGGLVGGMLGTKEAIKGKELLIENAIKEKIQKGTLMEVEIENVSAKQSGFIIGDKLKVEVTTKYKLPLPGIFKLFGNDGTISDSYKKEVKLSNTEANMRAVSYAKSIVERINKAIENNGGDTWGTIKEFLAKMKYSLGFGG